MRNGNNEVTVVCMGWLSYCTGAVSMPDSMASVFIANILQQYEMNTLISALALQSPTVILVIEVQEIKNLLLLTCTCSQLN